MPDCSYTSTLEACHDGELSVGAASSLEQHMLSCPECSAEMTRIKRLSSVLQQARPQALQPVELMRIHQAVDAAMDRSSVLRIGLGLSGIAASVLIISGAWLMEGRGPSRPVATVPQTEQNWERLATSGGVENLPAGAPNTTTAERQNDTADWMVVGMGGHAHGQ